MFQKVAKIHARTIKAHYSRFSQEYNKEIQSLAQRGFRYYPKFIDVDIFPEIQTWWNEKSANLQIQETTYQKVDTDTDSFLYSKFGPEQTIVILDKEEKFPKWAKDLLPDLADACITFHEAEKQAGYVHDWKAVVNIYDVTKLQVTNTSPITDFYRYPDSYGRYEFVIPFGGERILQLVEKSELDKRNRTGNEVLLYPNTMLVLPGELRARNLTRVKPTRGVEFDFDGKVWEKKSCAIVSFFSQ